MNATEEAIAQPIATVDALIERLRELPVAECPVTHRFTPGLYVREIFMPAGGLVVSKIHKTEHPFAVLTGRAAVWIEGTESVQEIAAPYIGVTKPGTRRVLFIREDCRWVTFHPTQETDLEKIEAEVIAASRADVPLGGAILRMLMEGAQ